jgi:hypothetical protein
MTGMTNASRSGADSAAPSSQKMGDGGQAAVPVFWVDQKLGKPPLIPQERESV